MTSVATHCPYCALQCGIHITASGHSAVVEPNTHFPVNKGGLCVKGWSAAGTLAHAERITTPLIRQPDGSLTPASWPDAIGTIVTRFRRIQAVHGPNAVGVFGGGSLTNEKAYLLGKFARVALGTANIDYNGRFCMSSAAAAANRALGIDRGLPFPLEDIAQASVVLLVGANPAETMPPVMQYFEAQQRSGGRLIVVDPRRTATAAWASEHLPITPGTDAALANGLLHILIRDGFIDDAYVSTRTEDFDEARRVALSYWPERVERITGIAERTLVDVAHALGRGPRALIITARGPEQQSQGVNNVLAYINVALALGSIGKCGSGFGSLTGQGNGQGGREHGQKSDQLPGYRSIESPEARRRIAAVWKIREEHLPRAGLSAFELLDALGTSVHGLFVMGSNPIVSAPDATRIGSRLASLDTLVVSDFFLSETAARAHVVLPSAQWAEEDGTMTNLEGRVILRRRALSPPESVLTDIEILTLLGSALGHSDRFPALTPAGVFAELARATEGAPADYSAISHERLDASDGLFWPCNAAAPGGTPRLFADTFPTASGRARFHATPHVEIADMRDGAFPLFLTTGRIVGQYQSGTQTRRTPELHTVSPEPYAELHPDTAAQAGVGDEDQVVLTSRRGTATFKARLTRTIRPDTVFVPFHWPDQRSANNLTVGALDPISRMPEFKVCSVSLQRAATEDQ
jgi:assimilatory nitrate reductase catalytic subunit